MVDLVHKTNVQPGQTLRPKVTFFFNIGIQNIPRIFSLNMNYIKWNSKKKIHHNKNLIFFEYRIFQKYTIIGQFCLISGFFGVCYIPFFTSQHFFAVNWNMEYYKINASKHKKMIFLEYGIFQEQRYRFFFIPEQFVPY